ncbi:MAG: SDR family NAD(P)-dependent oxidoreductase [Betaproteobacteria bacterium]
MKLLEGDAALVTGAGRGIGKGVAEALKAEGAAVLGVDLQDADLTADLSRTEDAKQVVAEAIARLGWISILVHCASPRRHEAQNVLAVKDAEWREMLAVNLDAGFALSQAVAAHMVERKLAGRIVLMTSLHAQTPRNLPHYSAAKAGETMLVKELARALGPKGIRVNAIAPGAIPGGGFQAPPGMVEKILLRRFGTPADVAAMTVAVLSQRFGAYVTGTTVVVDGGIALNNWIEPPAL